MAVFLKIAIYIIVGLVLVIADLVFARRLASEFRPKENRPPVIAPFRVIGKATTESDKVGEVMAQMLVARAHALNVEIDSAIHTLTVQQVKPGSAKPEDPATAQLKLQNYGPYADPVQVATLASQAPDMKVSFAGVEVSGLVAWAQRSIDVDRTISVAISYSGAGSQCSAVMSPRRDSGERWVETTAADDATLIENLAYAMHKRWMGTSDPLVEAMSIDTFKTYIHALKTAAHLNHLAARKQATEQQYEDLRLEITKVIDTLPDSKWGAVFDFAAQVAERANRPDQVVLLYERELEDISGPERTTLEAKIADLRTKTALAHAASQSVYAPDPLKGILAALGVSAEAMQNTVKVAIIGPSPDSALKNNYMRDYISGLVQAVKAVAPKADVSFVWPAGTVADAVGNDVIYSSIDQALSQHVPVILCPYGPLGRSATDRQIFAAVADKGVLLVVPAGNENAQSPLTGTPIASRMMIVSAADRNGKASKFTNRGPDVVWTIGADVPLKKENGQINIQNGTSIASAFAAGMAPRLVSEKAGLKPEEAIKVLRETSRSSVADGVPLANLDAAIARIRQGG